MLMIKPRNEELAKTLKLQAGPIPLFCFHATGGTDEHAPTLWFCVFSQDKRAVWFQSEDVELLVAEIMPAGAGPGPLIDIPRH